jgi:hypothetical protein
MPIDLNGSGFNVDIAYVSNMQIAYAISTTPPDLVADLKIDHVAHVSKMPASVADIKINGNDNMNVASLINGRYDSGAIIASNDQKKIGSDGHGHAPFAGVQAGIAKIGAIDLGLGVGHKPPLGLLPA